MLFKCEIMYFKNYQESNSKNFEHKRTRKVNITNHIIFLEVKKYNSP